MFLSQPSITIEDHDGPTPSEEIQTDNRGQIRPAETKDGEDEAMNRCWYGVPSLLHSDHFTSESKL